MGNAKHELFMVIVFRRNDLSDGLFKPIGRVLVHVNHRGFSSKFPKSECGPDAAVLYNP